MQTPLSSYEMLQLIVITGMPLTVLLLSSTLKKQMDDILRAQFQNFMWQNL